MKILSVQTQKGLVLEIGDRVTVRFFNIVNDEEDKDNPVTKTIAVESFEPNDDGSLIRVIGDDGESYYDDNVIERNRILYTSITRAKSELIIIN